MFCPNCGVRIDGDVQFCPSCGERIRSNASYDAQDQKKTKDSYNIFCILGLVIAGISLLINFWGIVGIAAVILSIIGLVNCKKKREKGKTIAIIGIAIGTFSIFYGWYMLLVLMTY